MARQFNMQPHKVPSVSTKYRKIVTEIPTRESLSVLDQLHKCEPISMSGQLPVIWGSARDVNVYDLYGNMWLDFSSGVVVANSGHGNPEILKALQKQLDSSLLHSYCFPNLPRADLVRVITENCPEPLKKAFLLSTGSEAAECAIKLSRTYGKIRREDKIQIISFDDGFHGRTLGSLQVGGTPAAKHWITHLDPDMIQVPFPNAYKYDWADENSPDYSDEKCFAMFMKFLLERGGKVERIAAIMSETFQGGWVQLMPKGFVKLLRAFAKENDILLIFDEIQAGCGRTGRLFGFEHYEVVPDIMLLGKGLSGCLPVSAVVGRKDVLDLYGPNQMTSTHSGNPLTTAAAVANLNYILDNKLPEHAFALGETVIRPALQQIKKDYSEVGFVSGIGFAWSIIFAKPGTKQIDCDVAYDVVEKAFEKGLLFFAPVGAGSTIKIVPPLTMQKDALIEGLQVLREALCEVLGH